ncbi:2-oxo acid dehydrogenase subunit E2, partial [Histidinibacterium lentulum]
MTEIAAAPSVRKRAAEMGIDLEALARRTGRSAFTADDLADGAAAEAPAAAPQAAPAHAAFWDVDHAAHGPVRTEPLSRIDRAAALNLGAANATIPQVTHHDRARVDALEELRARAAPEARARGLRLTPLAFHVLALARALAAYPRVNASLSPDGQSLILKDYIHIAIAVDTPHGLMVPVIRNADQKGLWDIAADIETLAARARDRKLGPGDQGGASITISSLGKTGGTAFTPLVNPPELAILGLSATRTDPLWTGETWEPARMLPLSLSYDHRAINGALAANLATHIKSLIENPKDMML